MQNTCSSTPALGHHLDMSQLVKQTDRSQPRNGVDIVLLSCLGPLVFSALPSNGGKNGASEDDSHDFAKLFAPTKYYTINEAVSKTDSPIVRHCADLFTKVSQRIRHIISLHSL